MVRASRSRQLPDGNIRKLRIPVWGERPIGFDCSVGYHSDGSVATRCLFVDTDRFEALGGRSARGAGRFSQLLRFGNQIHCTNMLYTIAVILILLWLLGIISAYTINGFIHILLVIAIIAVLVRIINGQRPL